MSNQKNNPQGGNPKKPEVNAELLNKFLEVQKQEVLNESKRIELRKQEMNLNTKLAERSIDAQLTVMQFQPAEKRKARQQIFWFSAFVIIIILAFLSGCLYLDKEDFAKYFLGGVFYLASIAISFYVGRKSKKNSGKEGEDIPDVQVVED